MKTRARCWKMKVYFHLTTCARGLLKELYTYIKKNPKIIMENHILIKENEDQILENLNK